MPCIPDVVALTIPAAQVVVLAFGADGDDVGWGAKAIPDRGEGTAIVADSDPVAISHDLDALRAIYAEAGAALDGWTCDLSSDCCHFARTGREPYVWPNEWALLARAIAARGVRRGPLLVVIDDDRRCPLLGEDGRCTVYDARPFGCRTFFCERGAGPARKPPRDVLAALGRRVAALAERADPACDGPRPLTSWLATRGK